MEHITPANGNPPIGPYTPGIKAGNMCFTSGQLGGTDPDIAVQAENACKNVGAILEAAGFGFEDVVKTTCYLTDIKDFAAFNAVYAKYFTGKPARSCVAVKTLPKNVLCEIELIAEL